ncbi:hypothetical protein E0485_23530 [Paenibacillus albiflavus]|uniref:YbbR-like domain-containing protein n=1 Tax=Paenibacillus albiflavus TaxID=2545760 RepID=A0A4R4E003_9BACL|nr:CdaR family protein [Paenibacillus albiflavus]TCZ69867.1 hypothetical protein E0485_23530 [Paenibacillus albiflavus]
MDKLLGNKNFVAVLALLIGILLWLGVNLQQKTFNDYTSTAERTQRIKNVQIVPKYDKNQVYITDMNVKTVDVVVRGKESQLNKVNTEKAHIEVDLTKVGKGEYKLPLVDVGFPVDVIEIIPSQITVVIDDLAKVEMPVEIDTVGKPAEGLKVGETVVKPNRVHVTLPTSWVDDNIKVKGKVSVEGAKENINSQVKLVAVDKNGKELDFAVTPSVVDVEVAITKPYKQIPLQIKLSGEPPSGYAISKVTQSVDKVRVFGEQSVLDALEFYEGPQINVQGLTETKEYTVELPLKNKISLVDPAKVTVKVEITPSITKTVDNIGIKTIGLNDGFTTKIISPDGGKISLPVEGTPDRITTIQSKDVQAIIDVTNLPAGVHDVPVSFNLPPYIKNIQQQEMRVTVEILSKQSVDGATEVGGKPDPGDKSPPDNGTEHPNQGNGNGNGSPTDSNTGAVASPNPNGTSTGQGNKSSP